MSRLWLLSIAAVFLGLLGAGLGVALTLELRRALLPADRPEGVVQRFILAVEDGRFEEAYGYLSAQSRADCPLQGFIDAVLFRRRDWEGDISLDRVVVMGTQATVWVTHEEAEPFGGYGYQEVYRLVLEDGQWRIEGDPRFGPAGGWCPPRPPGATPIPAPSASPIPGR